MALTDSSTLQALRWFAAISDAAWSAHESVCREGFHHLWAPAMYAHADPGGRIQFWRCSRCAQHKLQVVNSGETVYATVGEGGEPESSRKAHAPATAASN